MPPRQIAIVGGGPAGAFAAEKLARAGFPVTVFDEKLAWEKPCGGGLTDKAIARWPFLREACVERNWITDCKLIAPSGRAANFRLDRPMAIFSRFTLNSLLLERARSAGAQLVRERIVQIEGKAGHWILKSVSSQHHADSILLATGARNPFRGQFAEPFRADDFLVAVGYYIPGTRRTVQVQFLDGLHGYLWVFPRVDHLSAGICGRVRGQSTADLRHRLEACLPALALSTQGARFYAHIIPSLSEASLQTSAVVGHGWALAGDAAGLVDPITGEGLYYALRSGELFAQAVMNDAPESYAELMKRDFLPELERAARIADRFYAGEWMGDSVIERMVQLTARSPRFCELMRDLFAGVQEYSTLRHRLYRSLPKIAAEALVSSLWQVESSAELKVS
jgi:geranylgeranyl diphosphate/geranylgeranyl-bacteriochlorophyllide a reductase